MGLVGFSLSMTLCIPFFYIYSQASSFEIKKFKSYFSTGSEHSVFKDVNSQKWHNIKSLLFNENNPSYKKYNKISLILVSR